MILRLWLVFEACAIGGVTGIEVGLTMEVRLEVVVDLVLVVWG